MFLFHHRHVQNKGMGKSFGPTVTSYFGNNVHVIAFWKFYNVFREESW